MASDSDVSYTVFSDYQKIFFERDAGSIILKPLVKMETFWKPKKNPGPLVPKLVCVECLIGKQKKPILFNLSRFKLITDRVAFEPICLRRQNLS